MNLPVPGGSGDTVYRSLVAHVVAPLIEAWEPQLVLVSAGFDGSTGRTRWPRARSPRRGSRG